MSSQAHYERIVDQISGILKLNGYTVFKEARVTKGFTSSVVDLLGEKGNTKVVFEVQTRPASFDALAAITRVNSKHRFIVAPGWVDAEFESAAKKDGVSLLTIEEVEKAGQHPSWLNGSKSLG